MSNEFEYITVTEFAQMCKVSVATAILWRRQGIGPQPIKVGRTNLYRRQEAEEWAKNYIPYYTCYKLRNPGRYG
jgi:predicted DNA-binding transcriptional regulator AlpA